MAKFEVRIHGGGMVAEFDNQQEAIDYIQGKDDPRLYVFQDVPKEPIKHEPPSKFELWWVESMETKWWFRYLNAIGFFIIGFFITEYSSNEILDWLGKAVMLISALVAYELFALGALILIVNLFFDGSGGFISTPFAIVIGACIIAFAIYKKKK